MGVLNVIGDKLASVRIARWLAGGLAGFRAARRLPACPGAGADFHPRPFVAFPTGGDSVTVLESTEGSVFQHGAEILAVG